ncbi:tRNA (adenosine(37)-N6)-threonylcarbamoyltransferase complex dimerization subunit type 1 TsaB, partial [Plesiomonas sp.]|uniref:tRNA (adenosine(37)-N6)-threonylcarbamoyltransferase complex dimerization subunit type 1 TsaB n=1 Tax=Plesiomonas sp. TaxID=2486279 RepID=UPI003F406B1F
ADLPMIGVSNLLAMAQGAYRVQQHQQVLVAIDARMGEVYWGQYLRADNGEWQVLGEEAVLEPQNVQVITEGETNQWATAGTGFTAYPTLAQQEDIILTDSGILLPEARDMLPQAVACWQRGEVVAVENAAPVYLRNNVAWKKLPGRE